MDYVIFESSLSILLVSFHAFWLNRICNFMNFFSRTCSDDFTRKEYCVPYNRSIPFNNCSCKILSSSLSFTPYFCMCMCNCWCETFEHSLVCMCNGACSSTHRKLHTVSWKGISNTLPSDFVIFKAMLCPNFVHTEGDG